MTQNSAAAAYRSTSFETAPPLKVLRLLYAGAMRFLDQALACDIQTEPVDYNQGLSKAGAIVCELRCSLDSSHSEELAEQLESLYSFIEERLGTAALDKDKQAARDARKVLETLKDAWDKLELEGSDESGRVA